MMFPPITSRMNYSSLSEYINLHVQCKMIMFPKSLIQEGAEHTQR